RTTRIAPRIIPPRSAGRDGEPGVPAPEPEALPGEAPWSGSAVIGDSVPGGLGQLVLDRPEGRLRPRGQAELAENVRDVRPGRPLRDEEARPDLLFAHALAEG